MVAGDAAEVEAPLLLWALVLSGRAGLVPELGVALAVNEMSLGSACRGLCLRHLQDPQAHLQHTYQ